MIQSNQSITLENQFTHKVHERVQFAHIDPHGRLLYYAVGHALLAECLLDLRSCRQSLLYQDMSELRSLSPSFLQSGFQLLGIDDRLFRQDFTQFGHFDLVTRGMQSFDQFTILIAELTMGAYVRKHLMQLVANCQESIGDCPGRSTVSPADCIQQVFRMVAEFYDHVEAEETGGSLHRMHRAEHTIDELGIGGSLHTQQVLFHTLKLLFA